MLPQGATTRFMLPVVVATSVWAGGFSETSSGAVGSRMLLRLRSNDPAVPAVSQRSRPFAETRVVKNTAREVTLDSGSAFVPAVDRNLARLRRFRGWQSGWDGEGAPAPDPKSLDTAVSLLSLLARELAVFSVGLDAEARPTFNLRDSAFEGYVAVEPDASLSFSFVRDNGTILDGYDLAFTGRELPCLLQDALSQV